LLPFGNPFEFADEERRAVELANEKLKATLALKETELARAIKKASELNILITDLSATNSLMTRENDGLRGDVKGSQKSAGDLGERRAAESLLLRSGVATHSSVYTCS
jgi:hypothetical protein